MSIQSNFPNLKPSLLLDFANTKQLDNRVTFTRSTPAVYYDGRTTAKAEQNLLTYSQEFDNNAWYKREITVTANATTAPDGTTTADLITPSTVNEYHYTYVASTPEGAVNACFSVYAKSNGYNNLFVRSNTNVAYMGVNFNLSTGVVSATEGTVTGTITSVGNGWYRCSVNYNGLTLLSQTQILINPDATNSPSVWTPNGTSGVYLWGAQIETNRSLPTAYTATTTQAITNYIPVLLTAGGNQPRFDCNPTTGESLGLLIEEQRTNVFFPSEGRTSWSTDGTGNVFLDSATINPAGQAGGWIYKNAGYAYLNWGSGVSAGTWTYSVYIKKGLFNTTNVGQVALFTPAISVNYNFGTGALTLASGSPVSYGCQRLSDTMARVWITFTISGATIGVGAFDAGVNATMLWGLQIESGSFQTSYIKTIDAAATRTADNASMTGTNFSSWFNNGEGTLYSSASLYARRTSGFENIAMLSNGATTANSLLIGTQAPSANARAIDIENSSVVVDLQIGSITLNTEFKMAFAYKVNDFAMSLNGGSVQTDNVGNVPNSINLLTFGREPSSDSAFAGYIRKFAYYPIRVSNTNLQALTS